MSLEEIWGYGGAMIKADLFSLLMCAFLSILLNSKTYHTSVLVKGDFLRDKRKTMFSFHLAHIILKSTKNKVYK